jgi:threonine/homoserine/homoserine lactone efflux protein
MSLMDLLALFGIMVCLAALPSSSVALVVVHSAAANLRSGLAVSVGIVAGDLLLATLAIVGMTTLAEALGSFFLVLRYCAAAYLLWLGVGLIRSAASDATTSEFPVARTLHGSFLAGFLLTLGDVKAILFYASLFPAFIDLANLSAGDMAIIMAITALAVGGVKAVYAFAAQRVALSAARSKWKKPAQMATGSLMVGAGGYLIARP